MRLFGSIKELVAAVFRKDTYEITLRPNQSTTYTANRDVQLPPQDAAGVLVSANSTQILTNKTIDGDDNTVQDLALSSLKTVGGDANKVLRRDNSGVVTSGPVTISNAGAGAGFTQLDVDNVRLDGNTISSTDTDGNLVLDANGTGLTYLNDTTELRSGSDLILRDDDNSNKVTISVPSNLTGDRAWAFPDLDGSEFVGTTGIQTVTNKLTPVVTGSSSASGSLTLRSTSHATKGHVLLSTEGSDLLIGDGASDIITLGGNTSLGSGQMYVVSNQNTVNAIYAAAKTGVGPFAIMTMAGSHGTIASPTRLSNGDTVGRLSWRTYDTTTVDDISEAKIQVKVEQASPASGQMGARMEFYTCRDSTVIDTERMRLDSTGQLVMMGTGATAQIPHIIWNTDAVGDIGTSGKRPNNILLAGSATIGSSGAFNVGANTSLSDAVLYSAAGLTINSGAGTLTLAASTVTNQLIKLSTAGATGTAQLNNSIVSLKNDVTGLAQTELRFYDDPDEGTRNYAAIKAPATLSADYTLTLPVDDGTANQALTTDGNGVLSWTTVATASTASPTAQGLVTSYFPTIQSSVNSVSGDYTVTTTDGYEYILVTTSSTNRTVTLPTASANTGRRIIIKKVDGGTGTVSTSTINEAISPAVLYDRYESVELICNGTDWFVVNQSGRDPRNMSSTEATKLGLKQYLSSGSYNGGGAPSISGVSSTTRGAFVPYMTQDGIWRLRFNFDCSVSSGTSFTITISGVTFKTGTNQALVLMGDTTTAFRAFTNSGASTIGVQTAANISATRVSGDVELDSKPTWAY